MSRIFLVGKACQIQKDTRHLNRNQVPQKLPVEWLPNCGRISSSLDAFLFNLKDPKSPVLAVLYLPRTA